MLTGTSGIHRISPRVVNLDHVRVIRTTSVVGNVVWAHRPGTQRGCVGIGSGDVVLRRLIKLMTELIEL